MEKGKHALTAIEGLWQALWNSPPPHEVVEALERGELVWVKRFDPRRSAQEVVVEVGPRKEERPLRPEVARIPKKLFSQSSWGKRSYWKSYRVR
jgi:hypothetical protein